MDERQKNNLRIIPGIAELWSDQDKVSWIVFLPDAEVELKDVMEIRDRGLETYDPNSLFYVLVDMREVADMTAEARAFAASKENVKYHSAMALVVSSMVPRIIGNVYIRMNRPERPTRMFNTTEEAHKWLISLRNSNPNYNPDY